MKNRYVRDHIGKENTTINNWPPKNDNKGPNIHNPDQFMASQNLLYNFF